MVVTSVTGHLTTHDFDGTKCAHVCDLLLYIYLHKPRKLLVKYKNWHSCNPEELFTAPIVTMIAEVWVLLFLKNKKINRTFFFFAF